jgi:hypothetical protein
MRALAAGTRCDAVPEWQHRLGNKGAAIEHFLEVAVRETQALGPLSDAERVARCTEWLTNAERLAADFYRFAPFDSRTAVYHQQPWRQAFQTFIASR